MARRSTLEAAIDRLYQLPPGEFVAARNALARQAGAEGAAIRQVSKPALAAWAVNQLYWHQRAVYQELVERAGDLRATHAAAARGRAADLRGAGRAHDDAVALALKRALDLLGGAGLPVTDATRQAIATTLRGLPADEPAGRLTRPIEPRGFGMLAAAGAGRVRAPGPAGREPRGLRATARPDAKRSAEQEARLASARAAEEAAVRATREAEQAVRRDQFDAARTAREAERCDRRVQQAREALDEARTALEAAEGAATAARQAHDAAQSRLAQSTDQLAEARDRETAARERTRHVARRP
jgi:hypothetical protein